MFCAISLTSTTYCKWASSALCWPVALVVENPHHWCISEIHLEEKVTAWWPCLKCRQYLWATEQTFLVFDCCRKGSAAKRHQDSARYHWKPMSSSYARNHCWLTSWWRYTCIMILRIHRPSLSASSTRAIKNLHIRMTRSWYLTLSRHDSSFYLTFLRHQIMRILVGINGPRHKLMQYETNLINLQISMEESFKSFLVSDGDGSSDAGVLICDRGTVQLFWKPIILCMFCSNL